MKRIIYQVLVLSVLLVIAGCASVSTYTEDEGSYNADKEAGEKFVFPDYEGLKTRVQIIVHEIPTYPQVEPQISPTVLRSHMNTSRCTSKSLPFVVTSLAESQS